MNDLGDVRMLAMNLLQQNGVGRIKFEFDNGKRRVAACHYVKSGPNWIPSRITMSRHYARVLPMDEVKDSLLHEIAHAIAGHDANHGPEWRRVVRSIGGKPSRCANVSEEHRPVRPVVGKCLKCNVDVSQGFRLPSSVYLHKSCREPLTYYRDGVKVSHDNMPARWQASMSRVFA